MDGATETPKKGWKEFFHSPLFVALLLWALSQLLVVVAFIATQWLRVSQLAEWKGQIDATLLRMDHEGTTECKARLEREDKDISSLESRMDRAEQDTRQFEVIKSEHRRLTQDVEELRHGKK